jgi:hypothetical protein
VEDKFEVIRTKRVDERCRAKFNVDTNFDKSTYKAVWLKQSKEHGRGNSDPQTIKTH